MVYIHSVSPKHLNSYVTEFEFRYNRRELTEAERFNNLIGLVGGKRLTYSSLIK